MDAIHNVVSAMAANKPNCISPNLESWTTCKLMCEGQYKSRTRKMMLRGEHTYPNTIYECPQTEYIVIPAGKKAEHSHGLPHVSISIDKERELQLCERNSTRNGCQWSARLWIWICALCQSWPRKGLLHSVNLELIHIQHTNMIWYCFSSRVKLQGATERQQYCRRCSSSM